MKINRLDTYIMVTLGFMPLIISVCVCIALIGNHNLAEMSTSDYVTLIQNTFITNLTYFKTVPLVSSIYTWSVTNMLGGTTNVMYDIAFSYVTYVIFLFLLYLLMSVLLFVVKFGIKCLNAFYEKGNNGGV